MNVAKCFLIFCLFTNLIFGRVFAQVFEPTPELTNVVIYKDTSTYSWNNDKVLFNGEYHLPFEYQEPSEVIEFYLSFDQEIVKNTLALVPTGDYEVIDSVLVIGEEVRFKVKFRNLIDADRLKVSLLFEFENSDLELLDIPLLPYSKIYAAYYPPEGELFVGEEKTTEIVTNNARNIVIDERWTSDLDINYRMERSGNKILLTLAPNKLGRYRLTIPLALKQPYLDSGKLVYQLPPIEADFTVKSGKLTFLGINEQEVTPHDNSKEPIEIQIDNNYLLRIGKTYRIEDQEEKGGALVGELFTKTRLNNNKVLCLFRPYAFHRKSEGYLYIKDGDKPLFVTSLDITPKTQLNSIYILREGEEWVKSNAVFPGERIQIKLEGVGLHKGQFVFSGIDYTPSDSLLRNESFVLYDVEIPINIPTRKIDIFDHSKSTGKQLTVKEYKKPGSFDFINLKLGTNQKYNVDRIERPIYYTENLTDLVIAFDRSKIDAQELQGSQHLEINVKISNKQGNLIEIYNFEEVIICPDESSVRASHYQGENCFNGNINLNDYLSRKTYNLDEWSKIELEIKHSSKKYNRPLKKRVQVYLKRSYNFDIDVSFPGGLLILKAGENEFDNFSGVSFAMIGQFSFYQKGKIARYQPYKLGAGFIAVDAFNFSEGANNRDVGLVIIGSVYPTSNNPNRKLTFPLYIGFGYLMNEQKMFSLVGPGIRVRL